MLPYSHILFDADGTLFDYDLAEAKALKNALYQARLPFDDAILAKYRRINTKIWQDYEKGQLDKETLQYRRFDLLFESMGQNADASIFSQNYIDILSQCCDLFPNAKNMLDRLKNNFHLAIVTNGIAAVQYPRLKKANLMSCFDAIFISEEIGHQKPKAAFFDFVFEKMELMEREKALIVGDSLSADIQGGINAGIDTCWFNPEQKENTTKIKATYEACDYEQLLSLLNLGQK